MAVPSMTVDQVSIHVCRRECHVTGHRRIHPAELAWRAEGGLVHAIATHAQMLLLGPLFSKAANLHLHQARQLPAQKLDVDTRAAVDVGRILISQKEGFHWHFRRGPADRLWFPPGLVWHTARFCVDRSSTVPPDVRLPGHTRMLITRAL